MSEEKAGSGEIHLNFSWFKKSIGKNKFSLASSIIAFFSLLITLFSVLKLSIGIGYLARIVGLFPAYVWIFLTLALILAAVLAYFEKYSLMFLPLILWLLFTTAVARTSNIDGLKNAATGEWTLGPDLDPFLYLRHAREISEGTLGKIDYFRQAPLGVMSYAYTNMMPWALFYVYKIGSIFSNSISITSAAIIAPVIFFIISVVGFFLFVYTLFSFKLGRVKALTGAMVASLFYSFVPSMLHRTVAGIPEIESLGMAWFWFAFLFFTLAWKQNTDSGSKENKRKVIIYGLLAGLFTGLMSWTWGGYRYIYMTLGLASFLAFFFNVEKKKNLMVLGSFLAVGLLIEILKTKSILSLMSSFSGPGLAFGVFLIMLTHFVFFETKLKEIYLIRKIKEKIKLPENILSIIIFMILSGAIISLFKPSFIPELVSRIIEGLLYPFGRARIALTVAENRAPYFTEVLRDFGNLVWLFLIGILLIFYESVKHFSFKKKFWLNSLFIIFILSFVFSRISAQSMFNGENFISKVLYLGGLILFGIFLLYVYFRAESRKDEKTLRDFSEINFFYLLLLAFSFWGIVSMRGAVRLFFIIAPIVVILASYFLIRIGDYRKVKDDILKMVVWILIFVSLIIAIGVLVNYAGATVSSSSQIVPSVYNQQWQYAMNWVEQNTPEKSIFVFWWDYGYWVQTLGNRPTMTDGAHANEWWDYTTARYLLTTSKPETALSLMKTSNVSYLLIDSTDIGKYSAFSSIGSDATGKDRLSWIPVMPLDPSQIVETNNKTALVYIGGYAIDKDIVYSPSNGSQVFLPGERAVLAGIILEHSASGSERALSQPRGVFMYADKRYDIPIRYVYYNGEILDFGSGINSLVRVIPGLTQTGSGISLNSFGAVIYLSEKTKDTLFSQLYLLDDVNNQYPTITLAHAEDDFIIKSLRQQGMFTDNFVYYQGLRGPIKIWKVDYPDNVLEKEEFLYRPEGWDTINGPWATLDNLQFTR